MWNFFGLNSIDFFQIPIECIFIAKNISYNLQRFNSTIRFFNFTMSLQNTVHSVYEK